MAGYRSFHWAPAYWAPALALLVCCATAPGRAVAGEWPQALACAFDGGTTWSYDGGAFAARPPSPLAFDLRAIDLDGQTAELVARPDSAPSSLRLVRAINANHFIEVANEGFLNLTTIYDLDPKTGRHPAVHSRHFGILGQPVFAQYTGSCAPR
ncbi:MAG: hypothetical protein NW217_03440 [Hyphomicrobiaceae bacterium]|nr:hypothetical protein [Hyphomicrobiaceae bacterium]